MDSDFSWQCKFSTWIRIDFLNFLCYCFSFDFDPSIRYTIWSIFIGSTFSSTTQYACIQTQAQRYMCVKDAKSAQKYIYQLAEFLRNTCFSLKSGLETICHECPDANTLFICWMFNLCKISSMWSSSCESYITTWSSQLNWINFSSSRDEIDFHLICIQLYPLFVTEIFARFPGFTGLFVSSILSATLSTFSSGVNSMATVILEDIYKRLTPQSTMTNKRQVQFSKLLCKSFIFDPQTVPPFSCHTRHFDCFICLWCFLFEK